MPEVQQTVTGEVWFYGSDGFVDLLVRHRMTVEDLTTVLCKYQWMFGPCRPIGLNTAGLITSTRPDWQPTLAPEEAGLLCVPWVQMLVLLDKVPPALWEEFCAQGRRLH